MIEHSMGTRNTPHVSSSDDTVVPDPTSARYRWHVVAMLWLVCFFTYADRQAIYAVFPLVGQEFGFDTLERGLIGSAFMWVYAGGAPFAGLLADRLPRVHLILGGCMFWSVVAVATAWCSKLWHFVAVRATEGFGETFSFPASMSLTADYHGPRTRSRAFALHQSSVYVGTVVVSWLGAVLAERYGWRMGFYVFGTAGLAVAVVLYLFLREPQRGAAERDTGAYHPDGRAVHAAEAVAADQPLGVRETLQLIVARPMTLCLMLAFPGATFVATIFLTWTPTFLVETFGYSLGAAGLNGAVFIHLASALSAPLAGAAADRLDGRFAGGRIAVHAAGLVVGSVFIAIIGLCSSTLVLIAAMTAFGLCKGCYDAGIFASLYDVIEPRARASAAGFMNTVGWGGGARGPLFVGVTAKYGGGGSDVENMRLAIAYGGGGYLACGLLLAAAMLCSRKSSSA